VLHYALYEILAKTTIITEHNVRNYTVTYISCTNLRGAFKNSATRSSRMKKKFTVYITVKINSTYCFGFVLDVKGPLSMVPEWSKRWKT